MKRQVSLIQLSFGTFIYLFIYLFIYFSFVLFLRKHLLHYLCYLFMKENLQGKLSGSAVHRCSSKQVFLNFLNIRQKTPALESLFTIAADLKSCIFIKIGVPTQVFFCEIYEIFKNCFLLEHFLFIILFRNFM